MDSSPQQNNRKNRRAHKSVRRKAEKNLAKANGQPVPTDHDKDPAILAMRVRALEGGIEKIVQVMSQNNAQMKRAFTMTDQHVFVLQRIIHDLQNDLACVKDMTEAGHAVKDEDFLTELMDNGLVNFSWYHNQYYQAAQLSMFMSWMQNTIGCWLPLEPKVEVADGTEDTVEEFGGDFNG